MNQAEQVAFARALLDRAGDWVDEAARARLHLHTGTGRERGAIAELLRGYADSDTALPPALSSSLWAWMNGFRGTDAEASLRDLARRIRVSPNSSYVVSTVADRADEGSALRALGGRLR